MKFNPLDPVTVNIVGYKVICPSCDFKVEHTGMAKVAEFMRRKHFTDTSRHNASVIPVFAETMSKTLRV